MYQLIDPIKTGIKLKMLISAAGYEVKDIQEYLYLSCPQPVYRWFEGKILPSVEHLCALSKMLNVHMEDLLVMQGESIDHDMIEWINDATVTRLLLYRKYMREIA